MSNSPALLAAFRRNFAPWALAVLVHGGLGLFTTLMLLAAEPVPPAATPADGQPPAQPAGTEAPTPEKPAAADPSHGKDMSECMEIIKRAEQALTKVDHYTCQFLKREYLGGKLQPEQTIDMVVRHEPFSVCLKWQKPRSMAGQEGMWIEGKHNGRMRVKGAGGWPPPAGTRSPRRGSRTSSSDSARTGPVSRPTSWTGCFWRM